MKTIPEIGREYDYLGSPVLIINVIPLDGGSDGEAIVEFSTRLGDFSTCQACELTERR